MNRLARDLIGGLAFGAGLVIIRLLFWPLLLVAAAGAAWAGEWSWAHQVPYLAGVAHVGGLAEHWIRVAMANRRPGGV